VLKLRSIRYIISYGVHLKTSPFVECGKGRAVFTSRTHKNIWLTMATAGTKRKATTPAAAAAASGGGKGSGGYEMPWVEKYRPRILEDVVGNDDTLVRLRAIAEDGNMPNLILCGPPGTGKVRQFRLSFFFSGCCRPCRLSSSVRDDRGAAGASSYVGGRHAGRCPSLVAAFYDISRHRSASILSPFFTHTIPQTTSVHALARQLLGSAYSNGVLELNASDSRGIDVSFIVFNS
jgi:hypothetical protein